VLAIIISAPSSTKNAQRERDPEMHQTKKGNEWHFGMKMHIGVDSVTGLVHSAVVTPANTDDKHALQQLLHGQEEEVYGDSAYASQGELINARAPKAKDCTNQRPGRSTGMAGEIRRLVNRSKSRVRSRVEHVFAVVKCQWGFTKVRYRGLAKNATRTGHTNRRASRPERRRPLLCPGGELSGTAARPLVDPLRRHRRRRKVLGLPQRQGRRD
jgi:IS5 family transposase